MKYHLQLTMNIVGGKVYGHCNEFQMMRNEGICLNSCRFIYDHLLVTITHREGVLIPSRNETRSVNTKWSVIFKNVILLKGLNADEKAFYLKVSQDMLEIGSRLHHQNADRRCKIKSVGGG